MKDSSLIDESLKRLVTQDPQNIVLYLDERGTPAVDSRFITGGVLVYSNADRVSKDWQRFSQSLNLGNRKGTSLSREKLLEVASFVLRQPLLLVAVWSVLRAEELERLQAYSQKYKRSKSPGKRFKKISASSWLWQHQIPLTMAYAYVSCIFFIGPVGQAAVHVDQRTDSPGMTEHYQALLEESTSWENARSVVIEADTPQPIVKSLEGASAKQWQISLNAKGPLAQLADIICAMFGRFMDNEIREPWEIVRLRYMEGDGKDFPPCMGSNITWSIQPWLEELNSSIK